MAKYDLLIDTSIFGAAVGVGRGNGQSRELLVSEVTSDVQNSARQLPLMVDQALSGLNASIADINRIVVSQGPGSFTGIRVGIAYAYGYFVGLSKTSNPEVKIAGVSSLKFLSQHLSVSLGYDLCLFLPSTKTTGFVSQVINGEANLMAVDLTRDLSQVMASNQWLVLGEWPGLRDLSKTERERSFRELDLRENARLALVSINDRLSSDSSIRWSNEMPVAAYLRKSTVEEKAAATD